MIKTVSSLMIILMAGLMLSINPMGAHGVESKKGSFTSAKATLIVKIGIVKIKRKGTKDEFSGKKGMLLYGGDQIKTGELSRAALILNDGTITKLHEKTNLVLSDSQKDKKTNRLKLLFGQLWAKVKKREHSLEIETPSAVAAIKGTAFELKVLSDKRVQLLVWNGLVEWFNAQGKVQVGASEESTADQGKKPGKPKKVDLTKLDQWFESVIEIPSEKQLELKIKDKDGQEKQIKLNYKKK